MRQDAMLGRVRGKLEAKLAERAEVRSRLEVLDAECARLEAGISVVEEDVAESTQVVAAAERPVLRKSAGGKLVQRIEAGLAGGGLRRGDLLKLLAKDNYRASTVDSAVNRMKKKGLVASQGGRLVLVGAAEGGSAAAGLASGDGSSASAPARRRRGRPPRVNWSALADRVKDAVAKGFDTRKLLVDQLVPRVATASSLDTAVSMLKKDGVLVRDGRKMKVVDADPAAGLDVSETETAAPLAGAGAEPVGASDPLPAAAPVPASPSKGAAPPDGGNPSVAAA